MIRRQLIRATIANWAGRLATLLVSLSLTPFIVHRLGDHRYGLWILAGSIIAQGEVFDLGVSASVAKYVAEYRARGMNADACRVVASSLCLYTLVGLLALALGTVFARYFPTLFTLPAEEHTIATHVVFLLGVQLAISFPGGTATSVLRGMQRYEIINAIGVLGSLTFAVAATVTLLAGGNVFGLAIVSLANALLTQAISILAVSRIAPWLRFRPSDVRPAALRQILSFSSWMLIIDAAGRVHTRSNEIIIALFLPVGAVSPYAIAQRLGNVPQTLADRFLDAFFPLAAQLDAGAHEAGVRSLFLVGSRLTLAMTAPFTTLLIVFAAPALTLWVGASYAQYAPLLIILAIVSLIDISQWPGSTIMIGMARHSRLAWAWVCIALSSSALSVILVPIWGIVGASIGVLVPTAVVHLGIILPYTARGIGVSLSEVLKQVLLPALLPIIPMIVALRGLIWAGALSNLVALGGSALLGLLTYAAGYLALTIRRHEGELLRNLISFRS